jgi:hypothetical protein
MLKGACPNEFILTGFSIGSAIPWRVALQQCSLRFAEHPNFSNPNNRSKHPGPKKGKM